MQYRELKIQEVIMNRIASFSVNHDTLTPGIYVSRIDGDVTTYDLRTRTPNAGEYMDNRTMHSVEHMLPHTSATLPYLTM